MTLSIPELRALVAAATPGPWFARSRHLSLVPDSSGVGGTMHTNHIGVMAEQDVAAFIAAARTAVPELLDRVEALEAENEKLKHAEIMSRLRSRRFSEQFCEAESKANDLRAALREALAIARSTDNFCAGRLEELQQVLEGEPGLLTPLPTLSHNKTPTQVVKGGS